MEFGYFTLSDNRYENNSRTPEALVGEIFEQCLLAERLGFNSAWIGEHHFNLLGVNPCPNMLLAQLAGATKRIRLGPAVVLLPVHHPIHVAEEWATLDLLSGGRVDFAAGRGYDRAEYEVFGADFDNSLTIFREGMEILWKAWTEPGKWSYKGRHYEIPEVEVRPKPMQTPLRPYVACFSRPSMELAAQNDWNIIFAPFAASMVYGSLANAVAAYAAECQNKYGRAPRRSICSYFIHIADDEESDAFGRSTLLRYFNQCVISAFPSDPKKVPPSYAYFLDIVDRINNLRTEDLNSKSILVGSPAKIISDLKQIEASGISEVILYFSYGLKPRSMVEEQMQRFMEEIAVHFDGSHQSIRVATA
jgi:alkanesulfonate monooxygenase SsuD/methylene tetrahydromethanopterin reductase-like flavin-dependent oxidoreductase (luciferase family)